MKKFLLLPIFICFCWVSFAQSIDHIVNAGETEQSIATRYGITVDKLRRDNPKLDFIGLTIGDRLSIKDAKIIPKDEPKKEAVESVTQDAIMSNTIPNNGVPVAKKHTTATTNKSASYTYNSVQKTTSTHTEDLWCGSGNRYGLINIDFDIQSDIPENTSVFGMSYEIIVAGYLTNYFSIGAGLGASFFDAKSETKTSYFSYERDESLSNLQIPIDIAATIPFGIDNLGLRLSAGPRFNFIVLHYITTKENNHYEDYDLKEIREMRGDNYKIFSCSLDLSARIMIKWFSIGVGYNVPLAKNASLDSGILNLGFGFVF